MNRATLTRRILGALFLAIAIIQLMLGETLLKGRLSPQATLIYWTGCIIATFGAIVCALVDVLRTVGQSRGERRALLETTLREIDAERERHQNKVTENSPAARPTPDHSHRTN